MLQVAAPSEGRSQRDGPRLFAVAITSGGARRVWSSLGCREGPAAIRLDSILLCFLGLRPIVVIPAYFR